MRIAIDMQGAQTESRFRGIGRYTMSFTKAIVRNRGSHEIILVLSGLFPETIEPIRIAFKDLLPQENIRIWNAPGPVSEIKDGNNVRRKSAEVLREAFIENLKPDVIHISSLFEGFGDDAVTSIGAFDKKTPVSVMSYDFIPLLNPDEYFNNNKKYKKYYLNKMESIKRANLYLAISEYTMQETIDTLELRDENAVINISTAVDKKFKPIESEQKKWEMLKKKIGIRKKFILYTGGADKRKNLERLVQAYATISQELLSEYQLVFAGKMPQSEINHLMELADQTGLSLNTPIFTGYVTDKDLIQLYNTCSLYVFPSWHEGFGLPALEAMSCGAPVIGSNSSSLPEVIGWDKALFNPFDTNDITDKINFALKNEDYREQLKSHGLKQSKKFSWDHSALKALDAWEKISLKDKFNSYRDGTLYEDRLLSKLVDDLDEFNSEDLRQLSIALGLNQSGSLEKQLFLDVSEICQNDAATGVQRVVRGFLLNLLISPIKGFRVEPVYATREHEYQYARKFTTSFLNLKDTEIIDEPIWWSRGDIFFGLDMQHHVQLHHKSFYDKLSADGVTVKFLVYDLLPIQLADLFEDNDAKELHESWLEMIANTDGAICISKATADAFDSWIITNKIRKSITFRTSWVHIGADINSSVPSKGLPEDAENTLQRLRGKPTFVCVSTLEPRKGQQQILETFNILWNENYEVNLVFVGKKGWKIDELEHQIVSHDQSKIKLFWLQGISDQYLEEVYSASQCLIAASFNEGFGLSLVEAAQHGLPIIARDIPVFREIAGDHAMYFNGHSPDSLSDIIKSWLVDYNKKQHITSLNMPWLTWKQSTERLKTKLIDDGYWPNQLLVDISELVCKDVGTGIQRVVRNVLREWMSNPPDKYRIELVYATPEYGYRYARSFSDKYGNNAHTDLIDEPICYAPGDIFFALDFQPQVQFQQKEFYQKLQLHGVKVIFLVHDLIPIKYPEYFPDGNKEGFESWLYTIIKSNGLICVSRSTAHDLEAWILENSSNFNLPIKIAWSYNGSNLELDHNMKLSTSKKRTINLDPIKHRKSFLMVGTIEPRKGHQDVLEAFNSFWAENIDLNLVIIGKIGWGTSELVDIIISHPEFNKRLFLFHGITDDELNQLYSICICLIAASYDEGFGLPLIEAAHYGLPIIARDIPVFREIAGNYAYYFNHENRSDALYGALKSWLSLFEEGQHPKSNNISFLTWSDSAKNLLKIVLDIDNNYYLSVMPSNLCQLSKKYTHKSNRLFWEYGWSHPEAEFRWTEGYQSAVCFALSFSDASLCNYIELEIHTLNKQHVLIYLNDIIVYDDVVDFVGSLSILKIKSDNFLEGNNELVFKLPDARKPEGTDPRVLSVALYSLTLYGDMFDGHAIDAKSQFISHNLDKSFLSSGTGLPAGVHYFRFDDNNFKTDAGYVNSSCITSNRCSGLLLYGPYLSLKSGHYCLILNINSDHLCGDEWIDVCANHGTLVFNKIYLKESINRHNIRLFFELVSEVDDLEIRFYSDISTIVTLYDAFIVEQANSPSVTSDDLYVFTCDYLSKEPNLESSNKILLIQTSDPFRYAKILDVSSKYNQAYCADHDFLYSSECIIRKGVYPHHAMYNRVFMLHDLLQTDFRGVVVYCDADAIVNPSFSPDIKHYANFLCRNNKSMMFHPIFSVNSHMFSPFGLNTGAFMLNLSNGYARELVMHWFRVYTNFYRDQDFYTSTNWDDLINDQTSHSIIMRVMFDQYGSDFLDSCVFEQIQSCWNGSVYNEGLFYQALRSDAENVSNEDDLLNRINDLNNKGYSWYGF